MNLNRYKELLHARKKEVLATVESLEDAAKPVDLEDPIGRLSRMDAIQQQQMNLHSKRSAEIALQQIEAALTRIEDESYGICLSCEEEISEKRLKARPESPLCTSCQA